MYIPGGICSRPSEKKYAAHRCKYRLPGEPKRIQPHKIGVSRANRGGAVPNAAHIHCKIGLSLLNDGLDPERCRIGEVVDYSEFPEQKRKDLEHNDKSTYGSKLYPRIRPDVLICFAIGGSHFGWRRRSQFRAHRQGFPSETVRHDARQPGYTRDMRRPTRPTTW